MEKSVQTYRLEIPQMLMSLQQNNASALHAFTNTHVSRHGGDPIPPLTLPEVSKIPMIFLSDTPDSINSDDGTSSRDEKLNISPEAVDEPEPTVEE